MFAVEFDGVVEAGVKDRRGTAGVLGLHRRRRWRLRAERCPGSPGSRSGCRPRMHHMVATRSTNATRARRMRARVVPLVRRLD